MVSVVVCTYNRDVYLNQCLEHLLNQTLDVNKFEVILVNNNSTDNTEQVWLNFKSKFNPSNFFYFLEKNQGLSFARNRGIHEAKGDIIVFVDDDAFAKKDYLSVLHTFFNAPEYKEVFAVGGKIVPWFENKKPEWMSSYLLPLVAALDMGPQPKPFKGRKFPLGANMIFRKEFFEKYGVFNTALGRMGGKLLGSEEKDIFLRLKKANKKIYYLPEAEVQHVIPDSRLTMAYIQKQAEGIGQSEKARVSKEGIGAGIAKLFNELIKIGGTLVLSVIYFFKLKPSPAVMLIRFRYWVIKGYICGEI